MLPTVKLRLLLSQQTAQLRIVDASVFCAVAEVPIQAPLAQFPCGRDPHHMIGTDPLHVMRRVDNSDCWIKSPNLINHRRRDLEVDIIQMNNIRMKILQNHADLSSCFCGINDFARIGQHLQTQIVEIDRLCVASGCVSYHTAFMLHSKILHLIPHPGKLLPDPEYIRFRSPVRIKKFIDDQYFHGQLPCRIINTWIRECPSNIGKTHHILLNFIGLPYAKV